MFLFQFLSKFEQPFNTCLAGTWNEMGARKKTERARESVTRPFLSRILLPSRLFFTLNLKRSHATYPFPSRLSAPSPFPHLPCIFLTGNYCELFRLENSWFCLKICFVRREARGPKTRLSAHQTFPLTACAHALLTLVKIQAVLQAMRNSAHCSNLRQKRLSITKSVNIYKKNSCGSRSKRPPGITIWVFIWYQEPMIIGSLRYPLKCFQGMRGSEVMMAIGFSKSSVAAVCFVNMYALPLTQIASSASVLSCLDSETDDTNRNPKLTSENRCCVTNITDSPDVY